MLIVIKKKDKTFSDQQKKLMRYETIFDILGSWNSVQKHYEIRGKSGVGVEEEWISMDRGMDRSMANLATDKPKRARSLMWYVDCLIVVGVLGVVAALVLINFVLV